MLRSLSFPRSCPSTASAGAVAQQKRFASKMFIPKKDKKGRRFYILNDKRRGNARKPLDWELFAINDLLLDLDAENCRSVRDFSEQDEAAMEKRWTVNYIQQRNRDWVDGLEDDVNRSRQKLFELSNNPVNPWRARRHDMLSLALQGVPVPKTQSSNQGSPDLTTPDSLSAWQYSDTVNAVLSENSIPTHATETDAKLLNWLKLRHSISGSSRRRKETAPSDAQIMKQVTAQKSIVGIRRLVMQLLASGFNETHFNEKLSRQIRNACCDIIEQTNSANLDSLELLTFVGTLKEKLYSKGSFLGGPLCGLALRHSAKLLKPEVTLDYLSLGFMHNIWLSEELPFSDVASTLNAYNVGLNETKQTALRDVINPEALLRALAGVSEEGKTHQESFRSIVVSGFGNRQGLKSDTILALYKEYILLLGRLGAAATLWREWRLIYPLAKEHFRKDELLSNYVESIFDKAANMVTRVGRCDQKVQAHPGPVECVILDYQAMKAWTDEGTSERKATCTDTADESNIGKIRRDTLDLSLDMWLREVTRAANEFRS